VDAVLAHRQFPAAAAAAAVLVVTTAQYMDATLCWCHRSF